MHVQGHAIGGDDAGGLLAAMLELMKSEVGELLGFRMGIHCDHPALFSKFIERNQHKIGSWLSAFSS